MRIEIDTNGIVSVAGHVNAPAMELLRKERKMDGDAECSNSNCKCGGQNT